MALIDTHCHAYVSAFDADRDAVLRQAFDAGVDRLLLPNIDADSVDSLLALSQAHPNRCLPMMGLHPCHVDDDWEAHCIPILEALDAHPASRWERLAWTSSRAADPGAPDRRIPRPNRMGAGADLPVVLHVARPSRTPSRCSTNTRTPPCASSTASLAAAPKQRRWPDTAFCFGLGGVTSRMGARSGRAPFA